MIRIRALLFLLVAALLLMPGEWCRGQSTKDDPLADRIADGAKQFIAVGNIHVARKDIERLLKDTGLALLWVSIDRPLYFDRKSGLSSEGGMIVYLMDDSFQQLVGELVVADRDWLATTITGIPEAIEEVQTLKLESEDAFIPLQNGWWKFYLGTVSGRRFLAFDEETEIAAKNILTAPPLKLKLDETACEIINTTGMTLIRQLDSKDFLGWFDVPVFVEGYAHDLTEAEHQWLSEIAEIIGSARLGLIGMKYHESVMQFRSRVLTGDGKSFEKTIDFEKANRDWQPELGLEADGLILFAAIQMEAFRSSAAVRVVPQVLAQESSQINQYDFLQGKMLRLLGELSGDSWNDLSVARVGLYQDIEERLTFVGVVDARNPDDVLGELRRLSRLTSPESLTVNAADRDDELLRLVDELASDDWNIADRAETRLVLAGKAAIPAMEKGLDAWSPKVREREERVLMRIRFDAHSPKAVVDPEFWTTLNPGLKLEESTGKIAGFNSHTIHVTPDSAKSEDDVARATRVMKHWFGPRWNSIQVVQVRDHFVFMVGSDVSLLERTVRNVDAGQSVLTKPFSDAGLKPIRGQIQVCLNTYRLSRLFSNRPDYEPENKLELLKELCWIGLDFDQSAASVDALVPVKQVIPFLEMGF